MTAKAKRDEEYSDAEAERRATEALRKALTTPYKPQQEMVGKSGRPSSNRAVKGPPRKR